MFKITTMVASLAITFTLIGANAVTSNPTNQEPAPIVTVQSSAGIVAP